MPGFSDSLLLAYIDLYSDNSVFVILKPDFINLRLNNAISGFCFYSSLQS